MNNSFLKQHDYLHGSDVIVHSSFSRIRRAFAGITASELLTGLQNMISPAGSLVFPAFTYCFKKKGVSGYNIFDRNNSPSLTGYLSEEFRKTKDTLRTSSATHSFTLWGAAAGEIDFRNSPASPLGRGSVLGWLSGRQNGYILMAGTDFSSLSFVHYLESIFSVPYINCSPWKYLFVEETGVSLEGEQPLIEVPGCSRSFTNFEKYLVKRNRLTYYDENGLNICIIKIADLTAWGREYLMQNPYGLLCSSGACMACDERISFLKI